MEVAPLKMQTPAVRELTEEEKNKLEQDVDLVSDFRRNRLELEAKKNWDLFYKRNTTKFFKDRHWTTREFEELTYFRKDSNLASDGKRVLFEVGCGVGNFIFPLLEEDPHTRFYACDFSPRAVDFLKSNPLYSPDRCTAFPCDITQDDITETVPLECVDIATMIFVLSAIHPDKMVQALENVAKTLKPNGILLIRDYGLYDHAMLRFSKGHKLSDYFYVRQDGTRAFYFSLEKLNSVMAQAGLKRIESTYIHRNTINKKEGIDVPRIFVQGKYSKLRSACQTSDKCDLTVGVTNSCDSLTCVSCEGSEQASDFSPAITTTTTGYSLTNVGVEEANISITSELDNLTLPSTDTR